MYRHKPILLLILLLAFALVGIHEADRGQERERQSALRLMPPPDPVQELATARKDLQRALSLLVECFGHPVDLKQVKSTAITITAYSSSVDQCDSTPHLTASAQPVRVGILAVSRDLIEEMGLAFGQRVLLPGYGLFEVRDLMHPRWRRKVDIWESDREAAKLFGKQQGTLIWVDSKKESV
jgi:3D (Asp-Asp-Asp) domain-containing protein